MALGATHWDVRRDVKAKANRMVELYGGSWNTYENHPQGYFLDDVSVDFWNDRGRGAPIPPTVGSKITSRLLQTRARFPIAWLIWEGKIWQPHSGWQDYSGWQGEHFDHVHVTFRLYSDTAGRTP